MDTTSNCSLFQASMATMWANGGPSLSASVSCCPGTASEAPVRVNGNDKKSSLARWSR